jgi:hypothetical protein
MWQHITSVYFLQHRAKDGTLEDTKFHSYLDRITAFIFAYAITNPGVNALRTPVYDEMVNIVNGSEVTFSKYKFNETQARSFIENYAFTNQRSVTRSMITWYTYTFPEQQLLDINEIYHLEHIYPKKRQEMDGGLNCEKNIDSLGNKVLLESSINIRASDYRFEDKKKVYRGEQRRGKNKDPSKIHEIIELVGYKDFEEKQIEERNTLIINQFFMYLRRQDLIA